MYIVENLANGDQYPIHIMNVASVRDVEKQLADDTVENFSILRFRPNIISMEPPPPFSCSSCLFPRG